MRRVLALATGVLLLAGCGIPKDPDNTLAHIDQSGEVVVGAAVAPPQLDSTVRAIRPVPRPGWRRARDAASNLDWKLDDLQVIPVSTLPDAR